MDSEGKPADVDPIEFVFDRVSILRRAHKELKAFDLDFDVADLLETAAWLAGDALPTSPELPVWTTQTDPPGETEDESEETGA